MLGLPKMSDTLLDYAQPLIDLLPDDHGPEELKAMLLFASLFWNAVGEAEEDLEEAVPILARKLVALSGPWTSSATATSYASRRVAPCRPEARSRFAPGAGPA